MSANILSQLKAVTTVVPITILTQAKAKDPPTDALPKAVELYSKLSRVGALVKEEGSGKLVDEWRKAVDASNAKPEQKDMASAISTLLAVKDEEELVSHYTLCSPLDVLRAPRNTLV